MHFYFKDIQIGDKFTLRANRELGKLTKISATLAITANGLKIKPNRRDVVI